MAGPAAGAGPPAGALDALRVEIRDEGSVRNKAAHTALGVRADGGKGILDLRLEQNEGAKVWLRVTTELENRGMEGVLLAVVDGPKGFPGAILAVFPEAAVQTRVVHPLRHSLDFVSHEDRKPVAAALEGITAPWTPPRPRPPRRASRPGRGGANTGQSAEAGGAPGAR